MKNISFALTKAQFRDRTKTVTRRLGWASLKPGERLMGCEKCQGLGKGGKIVRMGEIEVVSVRSEPLNLMAKDRAYGLIEVEREGFPDWTPEQFVALFCKANKTTPEQMVTRIEFRHVEVKR
jgi:hypothetical protein